MTTVTSLDFCAKQVWGKSTSEKPSPSSQIKQKPASAGFVLVPEKVVITECLVDQRAYVLGDFWHLAICEEALLELCSANRCFHQLLVNCA